MSYRNENLRRAVSALPCAKCGIEGLSQCAHSNAWSDGKGRGIKASDAATFPLCATTPGRPGCHERFDQYQLCTRDEMPAMTARFIAWTHIQLLENGLLKVAKC